MAAKHDSVAHTVHVQLIDALAELQSVHKHQVHKFDKTIESQLAESLKERASTLKLLDSHLQHTRQVKVNETSDPQSVDPWLTSQTL